MLLFCLHSQWQYYWGFRLHDVVHSDKRLYLVFEYLDLDLKKHMDSCPEFSKDPRLIKVGEIFPSWIMYDFLGLIVLLASQKLEFACNELYTFVDYKLVRDNSVEFQLYLELATLSSGLFTVIFRGPTYLAVLFRYILLFQLFMVVHVKVGVNRY